ncbi:MAG: NADH-quinone oxidoreductase subunit N [Deltaproteobacteria bacterium]|nr:NADH-quinone oxidoreductase subunit N [Deltaproteobacteria bacterium]
MRLGDIVVAPIALDLLLAGAALLVFVVDLIVVPKPGKSSKTLGYLTAASLIGVFVASFFMEDMIRGEAFSGAYLGTAWTLYFKRLFLVAGILASLGSIDYIAKHQPHRQGEYYLLLLCSLLGMTLLPGARDVLLLIVCFELMGIPLYILATYAKNDDDEGRDRNAPEAGLKLYLIGAASTAITLFGLSWVVGLAGSTDIEAIARVPASPVFIVGVVMIFAGMGFKIGAVPFHMWVPDTYQGAPTPFVAFLSVAPKAAGFAALITLFHAGFESHAERWLPIILVITTVTLVAGNLLALPQSNIKRLLAYSGVAQIGYMLMAFAAMSAYGTGMLLFYLAAYIVTNTGAFLVIQGVAASTLGDDDIEDLDGLYKRSPALALAMLLFLLSLAGIPFVAGFWGKVYVFMAVWNAGLGWLVLLGALFAVVGLFYYLGVVKAMYMTEPRDDKPVRVGPALGLSIALCLVGVVGMGVYPSIFVDAAQEASLVFYEGPQAEETGDDADDAEGAEPRDIQVRVEVDPPVGD